MWTRSGCFLQVYDYFSKFRKKHLIRNDPKLSTKLSMSFSSLEFEQCFWKYDVVTMLNRNYKVFLVNFPRAKKRLKKEFSYWMKKTSQYLIFPKLNWSNLTLNVDTAYPSFHESCKKKGVQKIMFWKCVLLLVVGHFVRRRGHLNYSK